MITNFNQQGGADDYRLYQLTCEDGVYDKKRVGDVFGLNYNEGLTTVMEAKDRDRNMKEMRDLYLFWKDRDERKAGLVAERIRNDQGFRLVSDGDNCKEP